MTLFMNRAEVIRLMNRIRPARWFLLVLFLISYQFLAVAQSRTNAVEALLQREMQERRIPGLQVAVVQRGKIVLLKSYGIANIQNAVPVTDKSVFSIYSCTKAFTGVAVMQLVEDGKLDLSAPVSLYLDGLPEPWQPVTIRQLLTHVSGLPNILNILDPDTGKLPGISEDLAWCKRCRCNLRPENVSATTRRTIYCWEKLLIG